SREMGEEPPDGSRRGGSAGPRRGRHAVGMQQLDDVRRLAHGVPDSAQSLSEERMGTKNQVLVLTASALIEQATSVPPAPMPHPRGYVCVFASSPVTVDGRLDEPAWRDAAWTEDFVDMAAPTGSSAPRTRVKMAWDADNLYIAAEIAEPQLWAEMTKHDSPPFQENAFEFFIDPDGDNHEYYEFEINALNTTWDLFLPRPYRDGGRGLSDWEILGLKSAVHLDGTLNDPSDVDRGWTIEIAVPWFALGEQAHRPVPPH